MGSDKWSLNKVVEYRQCRVGCGVLPCVCVCVLAGGARVLAYLCI